MVANTLRMPDANLTAIRDALLNVLKVADGKVIPPPASLQITDAPFGDVEAWRFVWSIAATAFDPRCAAHAAAAFGPGTGFSLASHALLWRLDDRAIAQTLRVLAPDHPMRRAGILVPQEPGIATVSTAWRVPVRVWNHVRGVADVEPWVATAGSVHTDATDGLWSPEQLEVQQHLAEWFARDEQVAIVVTGSPGSGRTHALARAAAPRALVALDFERVGAKSAFEAVQALLREAGLRRAIPALENLDAAWDGLDSAPEIKLGITQLLGSFAGPVVITAGTLGIDLGTTAVTTVRQHWPLPDSGTRRALWHEALRDAPLTETQLDEVASRYVFGAGAILLATRSAERHAQAARRELMEFGDVVSGVRDNIAERLGELARRVEVTQQWSELVLSPETNDDVTALVNRVRFSHRVLVGWGFRSKLARGSGVAALFAGPPGTGKTMVAGLIAKELALDLYQIDLSKIVSKWVGETEKQLARVFDAAEAGHALLLFDEADALFAKRSAEVKSAVDRYANHEVNYLLQRVESFGGVVILTTNLDASIDPALRRRLAAHITFGPPEYDERLRLWKQMLSDRADYGTLDLDELATEFEDLSGANIRNAVLAGAFLAAGEDAPIGQEHLLRGARGEYRAMGRVLGKGQRR